MIGPWIAPYDPNALGDLTGHPIGGGSMASQVPSHHHLLGQTNIKNYDGSWTEYGSLVGVPIELGA